MGGEVFDVLDGPREEPAEPLVRSRVRAASSGAEGWVTVKPKSLRLWAPRYRSLATAALEHEFKPGSKAVRNLEIGELLELLDGPKEAIAGSALRLKVRASKDGNIGWVSAISSEGK